MLRVMIAKIRINLIFDVTKHLTNPCILGLPALKALGLYEVLIRFLSDEVGATMGTQCNSIGVFSNAYPYIEDTDEQGYGNVNSQY